MPHRQHARTLAVVGAALCASLGLVVPAAATSTRSRAVPSRTMLVFLRPSVARTSPRLSRAVVATSQRSVRAWASTARVQVLGAQSVPDVLVMRLTAAEARTLSSNPVVRQVLPNVAIPGPSVPRATLARAAGAHVVAAKAPCGTAKSPELDPEGLTAIDGTPPDRSGSDGQGVKVAFLADGIDTSNGDLVRSAAFASSGSKAGSHVIVSYKDFTGDGTSQITDGAEAFGDAASIAAQGNQLYDLSKYVGKTHPLPAGCDLRIEGDAPGASLLALKVFGFSNTAPALDIVQAVNYAVAQGAQVINESFGFESPSAAQVDVIRDADEAAVAAGVTVVVSTGDAGVTSTIASPASDPGVLAVGASTTYRAYAQQTMGGVNALGGGAYLDDNISSLSSGGFAQDGKTVNLVAPGDLGWSLCSSGVDYLGCGGANLQLFGGTSESSPLTAGAAADVISAYESTHGGAAPTPQLVMQILTSTATDIDAPADQQGAGLLDVGAAIGLAQSIAGTTAASPPGGVLSDTTQVNLEGAPSSVQGATITLTNTSTSAATVQLATRALVPSSTTTGAVTLNPAKTSTQPTFVDGYGVRYVYQKFKVSVSPGTARVQVRAAFDEGAGTAPVGVSLFAPDGAMAAYSLPQGSSNFADVEVASPAPGSWTVVVDTYRDGSVRGVSGTKGVVRLSAISWRFATDGTITPSLSLAPGESAPAQLQVTLPSTPGDGDLAIVVTSGTQQTTIPVTVRTDVPIGAGGGTFSGVLTGGNGRGGSPGQTNTYDFTVPAGERDLDVGVAMATNPAHGQVPGETVLGLLVDPWGGVQAVADNVASVTSSSEVLTRFVNLYASAPAAGPWRLELYWEQPGAGQLTSIGFTGSVRFDQVAAATSLPDDAAATVAKAGHAYTVTITNHGVAPMELTPDARRSGSVSVSLAGASPASQRLVGAANAYLVPTETTSLTFAQIGSVPATFQAQSELGDPLVAPGVAAPYVTGDVAGKAASVTYAPPTLVTPGPWELAATGIGPYSSTLTSGSVTMSAHARTAPFDASFHSSYPDAVALLTKNANATVKLLTVGPGKSATLTVTIDPTAATGTVVEGTLYVDGWSLASEFPNPLAAIPYEYTVGS